MQSGLYGGEDASTIFTWYQSQPQTHLTYGELVILSRCHGDRLSGHGEADTPQLLAVEGASHAGHLRSPA